MVSSPVISSIRQHSFNLVTAYSRVIVAILTFNLKQCIVAVKGWSKLATVSKVHFVYMVKNI